MLNIVKIGSSLCYEIDLFWGYEILKLTFRALFMLEIPVSLLHIVHNTSKNTLKAENQKTCHGAKVSSLTSVPLSYQAKNKFLSVFYVVTSRSKN